MKTLIDLFLGGVLGFFLTLMFLVWVLKVEFKIKE